MEILSIERLKNLDDTDDMMICVEFDKNPEEDDEYDEDVARKLIIDFVNSYAEDDDYFELNNSIHDHKRIYGYDDIMGGIECASAKNRAHYILF